MTGLLLIAHAPLASALQTVARHTFPDCGRTLVALDVGPEASAEAVEASARALMTESAQTDWLVLTDVFGATPCNAALRLASEHVRVLSGVNVPMLWRTLCYAEQPLEALTERAEQGGRTGILAPTSLQT
jgi:PTS system ascorbate-specific IIA component